MQVNVTSLSLGLPLPFVNDFSDFQHLPGQLQVPHLLILAVLNHKLSLKGESLAAVFDRPVGESDLVAVSFLVFHFIIVPFSFLLLIT